MRLAMPRSRPRRRWSDFILAAWVNSIQPRHSRQAAARCDSALWTSAQTKKHSKECLQHALSRDGTLIVTARYLKRISRACVRPGITLWKSTAWDAHFRFGLMKGFPRASRARQRWGYITNAAAPIMRFRL